MESSGMTTPAGDARKGDDARFISRSGYDGCVELRNETTRVVLEPNLGGRVLSYQLHEVEALYQDPSLNGVLYDGRTKIGHPSAGRFDIGPEFGGLDHDELWLGRWTAEITGPRSARLSSATLQEGLQLVREFTLDAASSHLRCTQVFRNSGPRPLRVFHWSRTFARGNGIALAPLPQPGRFPRGYGLGGPPGVIDFQPGEDENVRIRQQILEIVGPPARAKIILEVQPGWLAYLSPGGLLFLKKFPVYSDRPYGELAANNASIWYSGKANAPGWPGSEQVVEIEPIGPLVILAPGAASSFTEEWWLGSFPFPEDRRVNLPVLLSIVAAAASPSSA